MPIREQHTAQRVRPTFTAEQVADLMGWAERQGFAKASFTDIVRFAAMRGATLPDPPPAGADAPTDGRERGGDVPMRDAANLQGSRPTDGGALEPQSAREEGGGAPGRMGSDAASASTATPGADLPAARPGRHDAQAADVASNAAPPASIPHPTTNTNNDNAAALAEAAAGE